MKLEIAISFTFPTSECVLVKDSHPETNWLKVKVDSKIATVGFLAQTYLHSTIMPRDRILLLGGEKCGYVPRTSIYLSREREFSRSRKKKWGSKWSCFASKNWISNLFLWENRVIRNLALPHLGKPGILALVARNTITFRRSFTDRIKIEGVGKVTGGHLRARIRDRDFLLSPWIQMNPSSPPFSHPIEPLAHYIRLNLFWKCQETLLSSSPFRKSALISHISLLTYTHGDSR